MYLVCFLVEVESVDRSIPFLHDTFVFRHSLGEYDIVIWYAGNREIRSELLRDLTAYNEVDSCFINAVLIETRLSLQFVQDITNNATLGNEKLVIVLHRRQCKNNC